MSNIEVHLPGFVTFKASHSDHAHDYQYNSFIQVVNVNHIQMMRDCRNGSTMVFVNNNVFFVKAEIHQVAEKIKEAMQVTLNDLN